MQDEHQAQKTKIQILALGFILFVLLIVLIWVINVLPKSNTSVSTLNSSDVAAQLSDTDMKNLEDSLATFVRANYPEQYSENPDLTVSVRPETINKYTNELGEEATFIIDVKEIKMTYSVTMQLQDKSIATFTCPSLDLMKYKDQFCIGYEGQSSIDVVLGSNLPHSGQASSGVAWLVSESDFDEEPYLKVTVGQSLNSAQEEAVLSSVKEWVQSINGDISADMFDYKIMEES